MIWLLGAVLLMGAYALSKRGSAPTTSTKSQAPSVPSPTSGQELPALLGDPPRFVQGQRYRMRFDSQLFDPSSTFGQTITYASASQLPPDWPQSTVDTSDPATQFASGYWSQATASVTRPQGLWQVWPTASKA